MSSPDHRPPGPSQPSGEGGSLITRDILEAYLNCHYKGYLKLIGERGTKSEYELILTEVRQDLRQRAFDSLGRRYRCEEIMKGVVITPSTIGTGTPFLLDPVIEDERFSLMFD